jgi:hypothetical protein
MVYNDNEEGGTMWHTDAEYAEHGKERHSVGFWKGMAIGFIATFFGLLILGLYLEV